ncbi:MAG: Calx-beta domain-containing protein, partial [Acutalibacteraceae bacterium]
MRFKFKKSYLKGAVALLLCFALLFSAVPAFATEMEKSYVALYDEEKVSSEIFADNGTYKKDYPDGVVLFPVVNAELKMDEFYSFELYRMGGADGEATVTLETVDFTAGYGIDYEIYLSNKSTERAVDGEAALMYATEEYSYIPVITSSETQVEGENTDQADSAEEVLASLSSDMQDLITPSSSFTVTFAPGESKKKFFIRTIKDDTITADLEFIINLKDAQGCEIGSQNSAGFTIKEEREKPETQLTITDTEVNPDSEQAYVIVSRGGNLGTYGSYRVVTESDTATAGEDYAPVQMQLDFLPGMSEQKIAIDILDSAKSGEKFKVKLENVKNANVINSSATVTFSDEVEAEQKHETVMSGAYSPEKTTQRDLKYIPVSKFSQCTTTNRGTGSQEAKFTLLTNGAELYYSNGIASKNNAISIRTNDKIDFTGVDKVSMSIDNYTGSCEWDHNAIYIADSDKFSSDTGDYDWLNSLDDDGVGKSWDMTNVSQAPLLRETDTLSESKINGEHYLYIMLHKGAFSGQCSFKIFSDSNTENNVLLHLKEYNIQIEEPDEIQLYRDGVLKSDIKPVDYMEITDPADGSKKTSAKIYRDETVSIIGNIMTGSGNKDAAELSDIIKLTSVVFCDPDDKSKVSEPVSVGNNGTFTLTSEIIEKYGSFFKNNKIIIKPIYSVDTAEVNFREYNCNGQQVKFNSDGCSAQVYSDNVNIGTLSWTKSARDGGKYLLGDELKFTFTSNGEIDDACVDLDYRSGATKSMAELERYDTQTSTTNSTVFSIKAAYTDIVPYVTVSDPGVMINITNP